MPDTGDGGVSSDRPGTDVSNDRPDDQKAEARKGKSRRRGGRRRKRKSGDIQAVNNANGQSSRPTTALTGGNGDARPKEADDSDPVAADSRNGKRARRRKRRNTPALAQVEVDRSVDNPQAGVAGNKPEETRHNRRRWRRGGRSDRKVKNAIPAQDQAEGRARSAERPVAGSSKNGRVRANGASSAGAYAALDLGTNNCRLLVAVPQAPGRFRVIDAYSRIVRLGEGLAATGRLSDAAMDRAMVALRTCAAKLKSASIRNMRLIATEACRRAENGQAFLNRVENETGLKLEVVDRETEARLAVSGSSALIDRQATGAVLFDIGGGSSELALLDLRKRKRHDYTKAMVAWTSLPLGVVTLSEKHGGGERVTPEIFQAMVDEVVRLLGSFDGRSALSDAGLAGEVHLLGTSGTVTTLAGIHLDLPRYDRRKVDGTWMRSDDVQSIVDQLVNMSYEERMASPCIGRERADLVLAGCAILAAIQKLWPCPRLRVADRGLREGLLTEMMNADNAWIRRPRRYWLQRG